MNFTQGLGIGLLIGFILSGAVLFPYIFKQKRESDEAEFYYQLALRTYIEKIRKLGGEV